MHVAAAHQGTLHSQAAALQNQKVTQPADAVQVPRTLKVQRQCRYAISLATTAESLLS